MSSKKARRRKRRNRGKKGRRSSKLNPAHVFTLSVAVAILLIVVGVLVFGDTSGPGEPPWPGAVWSPSHGHWH